jgi:hypothetical protein
MAESREILPPALYASNVILCSENGGNPSRSLLRLCARISPGGVFIPTSRVRTERGLAPHIDFYPTEKENLVIWLIGRSLDTQTSLIATIEYFLLTSPRRRNHGASDCRGSLGLQQSKLDGATFSILMLTQV